MTVTRLEPLDKKRTKVYLDEAYAFVLYHKELQTYGIAEGDEIRPDAYTEIMTTLLPKRATLRAMHLLSSRPYTEARLRQKLTEGGYPDGIVEEAISYVKSYGYVDDRAYAMDYATYHIEDRARGRIMRDLTGKGIAKEIVEEVLQEVCADEALQDAELPLIEKELRKKHYDPATATYEERMKIRQFLHRKGFSLDMIDTGLQKS